MTENTAHSFTEAAEYTVETSKSNSMTTLLYKEEHTEKNMTSIQIANECINSLNAYNKEALKVKLALNIDDLVAKKTKPLDAIIKEQQNEIEGLIEQIQFLEGRLESKTSFNG